MKNVRVSVYDRFALGKEESAPIAYLVPRSQVRVISLLLKHGVPVQIIKTTPFAPEVETFHIDAMDQDSRAFQGHKLIHLRGSFSVPQARSVNPLDYYVVYIGGHHTDPLAFTILEPGSTDGAAAWGVMGEQLSGEYPILRVMKWPS